MTLEQAIIPHLPLASAVVRFANGLWPGFAAPVTATLTAKGQRGDDEGDREHRH